MSITVQFGINYSKILTSCDDKNGLFSKLRLINGYGSLNWTLRCFANSALFNEIETEKKVKANNEKQRSALLSPHKSPSVFLTGIHHRNVDGFVKNDFFDGSHK